MAWCNSYEEPTRPDPFGPDPYDVNFCFPLALDALENDRVKLTPFIPRIHARAFATVMDKHPELFRYLPLPAPTLAMFDWFVEELEYTCRRAPGYVLFAIFDKTKPSEDATLGEEGAFAGMTGLLQSDAMHRRTEIGLVTIFPEFQRTHVQTNASGLLLQYCLNLPTDAAPGLGLRRVEWFSHTQNAQSMNAAERLGMRREGIVRWNFALPLGKEGNETREGDPYPGPGNDSVMFSMCWDDWNSGGKDKIKALMARTS